jgi:hypothetical protein
MAALGIKMRFFHAIAGALTALVLLFSLHARAQDVVVGVNVVNPMRASIADQDAVLAEIRAAGVHVIRCPISDDAKGIDFAKRAAAQGIKLQLGVGPEYAPGAPMRPYQPAAFPAMWGGPPLSHADPALSKASFQSLFDQLEPTVSFWPESSSATRSTGRRSIRSFHCPVRAKSSVSRICRTTPRVFRSPRAFANT